MLVPEVARHDLIKNTSSRPTALFCRFCLNDSAGTPFPAATNQPFSRSLSSTVFCSCLEFLSTTTNLCTFWRSKIQQVTSYAFCSWVDKFTQKWSCSSPNNLCKCTESSSTLSTNTSIEWKLQFVLKQPSCNVFSIRNGC